MRRYLALGLLSLFALSLPPAYVSAQDAPAPAAAASAEPAPAAATEAPAAPPTVEEQIAAFGEQRFSIAMINPCCRSLFDSEDFAGIQFGSQHRRIDGYQTF